VSLVNVRFLAEVAGDKSTRETAKYLRSSLQEGKTLSASMADRPQEFNDLYINMVRAGEAGGILPQILTKLGEFLEQSEEVRRYIVSSSIYPAILLSVGFLSILVIVGFVVPRFAAIFADLGQQLPLSTRMLMAASHFLQRWWWLLTILVVGAFFAGRRFARTPGGKIFFDRLSLRLPGLGTLSLDIQVSRFARTLGTLITSGVPLLKAIEISSKVVANGLIRVDIERIYQQVKTGKRISQLMRDGGLFPIKMVQMVTLGEETGQIGRMLETAANELDRSIEIRIKRYLALVEPIAILLMGLIIGAVVISMLSAILGINDISF
jgi:type II secretory pathway component PulF